MRARAAAVALLGYQGLWRAFGIYLGKATNQQAEIVAAALGLEALKETLSRQCTHRLALCDRDDERKLSSQDESRMVEAPG